MSDSRGTGNDILVHSSQWADDVKMKPASVFSWLARDEMAFKRLGKMHALGRVIQVQIVLERLQMQQDMVALFDCHHLQVYNEPVTE